MNISEWKEQNESITRASTRIAHVLHHLGRAPVPLTFNLCLLYQSYPILGMIYAGAPSSCSRLSRRELFYPTFVGGENAISGNHTTK